MKHLIKAILIMIAVAATASCRKVSDNGELDGMWQVTAIECDGNSVKPEEGLYYCFNLHTFNLQRGSRLTTANMSYDGRRVVLDFPYATTDSAMAQLAQCGICHNPEEFVVEALDGRLMVLNCGVQRIRLRRF